jgi:pilus assembly protein CpaE
MPAAPLPVVLLSDDTDLVMRIAPFTASLAFEVRPWNSTTGAADEKPNDPSEVADSLAASDAHAVCIGPDVPESAALDVSRALDLSHPEVGVVLLRDPTTELWREAARAGVRDIVSVAGAEAELVQALESAAHRSAQLRAAQSVVAGGSDGPTGRLIVVLSPKGGSGKTMLTTNLGVAIASGQTGQTAVVDLDCVFGDVASVLGLVPEHTIGQLATIPSFDSTTIKVFLTRHERSGLYVLAGSGRPEEGELVTDEVAGRVLDLLVRDFPYVVVDTAAGLDERALAAIDRATDIVLLASMDVASVRNLRKEIDALDRLGLTRARRHFILNRADTHVGLEVADVESAVGHQVVAALPSSRLVPLSMNQGRTVVVDEPDSPVARELLAFAATFLDVDTLTRPNERASRFSLWRR